MNTLDVSLGLESVMLVSSQLPMDKALRIVLLPGELYRVPRKQRELRVLSGTAWVSHGGKDYMIGSGDTLPVEGARHDALISDAEGKPLIFEVV